MQAITSFLVKRKSLFIRLAALVIPVVTLLAMLAPTVLAQTTYVITDGDQVKVCTTYATNPMAVLNQVGVELGEEDTYTTEPGDGVSQITVQRSQLIKINNCGTTMEVTSYGESLEVLLNRIGVPVQGEYVVSMPLHTETYDGMEVTVDHIVNMEQTYTVDIPFETVYCYDPALPEGQEEVLVAGTVGQMQKTASVEYTNTEQTQHVVLKETVVKQPVNRIVKVGTGTDLNSNAPAIGDGVIVTADGQVLTYSHSDTFRATAYTHTDAGCNMTTATGTTVRVGTVAIDPKVVPYGTRMFIVTNDGKYIYGIATAEDCGGGVKGKEVDLYFETTKECFKFGVRKCTIYFLD